MRVAIIDLGTNSVRFDVHQIGPGGRARQLHREKLMIRLGQGVFLQGKLDREAARRALHAFGSFRQTASDLQADKIVAFGTSALREASDGEKLLSTIRSRTGIDVRVISGVEEAKLIAVGVLRHEREALKGRAALVDIGGGSTEITVCRGGKILQSDSFPLGTARLQEVFLKSSPPKAPNGGARKGAVHPIDQLRRYIRSVLLTKLIAEGWPRKCDRVVGSSGTIKAISKIVRKRGGGKAIDRGDLRRLVEAMSGMTTTQLLGIPGMEARRVDMILAGAILLEECMDAVGAKRAVTTDYSLRDGILHEQVELYRGDKETILPFHLDDLRAKARRLGVSEVHVRQVTQLSEQLFDRLRPLHRLRPAWRPYLLAAAILHDVGEAVSPSRHEEHSHYIVRNADFPMMEKWEAEFVAELCLRHRGGKVPADELPFGRDKIRRQAFVRLLALLRVADALDRGHKGLVSIRGARVERRRVTLEVATRSAADLEILRVEQKKDLFEDVFGRELAIVLAKGPRRGA